MKKLTDLSWNVSEEEYRQDNSYSYSMLAKFNREGFENLDKLFDKISTPSLTFGSIVDCLLTDEQNFENRFVVCGNNDLSDLYRGINKVSDYIPLISEKLNGKSDTDIKKYYDTNKKEIIQNTGIIDSEDFVNFAKYILEFNSLKTLNSSAIITDTKILYQETLWQRANLMLRKLIIYQIKLNLQQPNQK